MSDDELLRQARELLAKYFLAGAHHVVCVLECGDNLYPSLQLNSSGYDVCAEPTAVANAIFAGERQFDKIIAITSDGQPGNKGVVIPPCGDCRQILLEYAPNVEVLVDVDGTITPIRAIDLLPYPYKKPRKTRCQ